MRGYEASGLGQRVRFLRETHFGRCGARVLNELSNHAKAAGTEWGLSAGLKHGLEWLLTYLPQAPPRKIKSWDEGNPVLIFTDGANEPGAVTIGGVLLERGSHPEYFGEKVPDVIVERWRKEGGHQIIGQAELLPIQVAADTWEARLRGRLSIWFADQDAARRGMIRGYSPAARSSNIIDEASELLAKAETYPWFARVASGSNPADPPSRLNFEETEEVLPGAVRLRIDWARWGGELV